jgi:hypothetical protein
MKNKNFKKLKKQYNNVILHRDYIFIFKQA